MGPTYGVSNNGMVARTSATMGSQNPFATNVRYGINGRYVQNPNEIRPGEIPMDGTVSFFPLSDNSAIIGKMWDQNGNIKEVRYLPDYILEAKLKEFQDSQNNELNGTLREILERISKLENSLNS